MNALRPGGVEIRLHHHADVFAVVLKKHMLHLPNIRKADVVRIRRAVALHLRKIKRQVRHAPGVAPALHQRLHARGVNATVTAVARALAPNGAANGIRHDRRNLPIEKLRRPAPHAGDARQLRPRRHPPAQLHRFAGGVLPLTQFLVIARVSLAALLG